MALRAAYAQLEQKSQPDDIDIIIGRVPRARRRQSDRQISQR